MATLTRPAAIEWSRLWSGHILLLLGMLAITIPTLISLAVGPWSTEAGVHGPLVLATGIWLIGRRLPEIIAKAVSGSLATGLAMMIPAVMIYVFSRAFDFISTEVAAMLLALLATAYVFCGRQVLALLWFPIIYLGFVIPIPGWVLDVVTQPLKALVSQSVTIALANFGYPVARVGVTIYVAQYQLLVEDACAGLNSLISLTAIGLFYVYILHNTNWRYSVLLLALVIPIAILANCIRVAALVLLTYYYGDAVAQGFLHHFAGMVTFTSALLFIFAIDAALKPVRHALENNPHQTAVEAR